MYGKVKIKKKVWLLSDIAISFPEASVLVMSTKKSRERQALFTAVTPS